MWGLGENTKLSTLCGPRDMIRNNNKEAEYIAPDSILFPTN